MELAGRTKRLIRLGKGGIVYIAQQQLGTLGGQDFRAGATKAATGAGNQNRWKTRAATQAFRRSNSTNRSNKTMHFQSTVAIGNDPSFNLVALECHLICS